MSWNDLPGIISAESELTALGNDSTRRPPFLLNSSWRSERK